MNGKGTEWSEVISWQPLFVLLLIVGAFVCAKYFAHFVSGLLNVGVGDSVG